MLSRVFQRPDNIRGGTRRGNADDGIIGPDAMLLKLLPSVLRIILGLLHGIAQGDVATGDKSIDHSGRNAKRWGQLGSIEHAKAATRARAHVEDPATALHARHDLFYQSLYLRYGFLNGESHFLVFMVDVGQQLMNAFFLKAVVQ